MATKKTGTQLVDEYNAKLDPQTAAVINELRKIILSVDKQIEEHIKWNSPAFHYTGDMKPFDPKEYKRDLAVMNLHRGRLMLVFPTGAKVKDQSDLLEGDFKDGRRVVNYKDLEDVVNKEMQLKAVVKEWLRLIDK
jgi:hypothetical protein